MSCFMASNHFFYVLYCRDDTLYAGYTTNYYRRLRQHNSGQGAKYLKAASRRPARLIYAESWPTKRQAMQQEYWFKQLTRRQKEHYLAYHQVEELTQPFITAFQRQTEEIGAYYEYSTKL
ncbi:GIY-YIG nuclease family protein [Dolosicoccus paucivorans]|uniref:GIY-YIG nuclease family protein n=1 Tax=Dolosicoccus paucivorans TaxID=84521 RepID=UPI00087F317A|nr:putative endonuclease [Dolosicoccus paucivorans]